MNAATISKQARRYPQRADAGGVVFATWLPSLLGGGVAPTAPDLAATLNVVRSISGTLNVTRSVSAALNVTRAVADTLEIQA